MSAILPPSERLWWKHPLDRVEGLWILISFVWCMVMFFMFYIFSSFIMMFMFLHFYFFNSFCSIYK